MLYLGGCTKIKGDVSSIGNLTELLLLNIDCTSITGDIAGMSGMKNLETFRICDSSLYGDISAFSVMHNLSAAVMHGIDIWGDVAVFKNMERLNCLLIQDTDVYETLPSLTHCLRLMNWDPAKRHGGARKKMSLKSLRKTLWISLWIPSSYSKRTQQA